MTFGTEGPHRRLRCDLMFQVIVQFIGVTTALPVVVLLAMTVWMTMQTYRLQRLRLDLRRVLSDDVERALEHPSNLSRDDLGAMARYVSAFHDEINKLDLFSLEDDELFADEIATVMLADVDGGDLLNRISAERSRRADLAKRNLRQRIAHRSPRDVVRLGSVWVNIEHARVAYHAFRLPGAQTIAVLLRRAGRDVTSGTVVGLVAGITTWFGVSQYQGRFYDYLGAGATLGAFFGLGLTAVAVAREAPAPALEDRARPARGIMLLFVWGLVAAFQVLMYIQPAWWPFRPQS